MKYLKGWLIVNWVISWYFAWNIVPIQNNSDYGLWAFTFFYYWVLSPVLNLAVLMCWSLGFLGKLLRSSWALGSWLLALGLLALGSWLLALR